MIEPPRSSPTCTMTPLVVSNGDIAVPQKSFDVSICDEKSRRQTQRAGGRVPRRDDRRRSERVEPAVGEQRRRIGPLRHLLRVRVLLHRSGVSLLPRDLARRHVDGHDYFVWIFSNVDEDASAAGDRRRVAFADCARSSPSGAPAATSPAHRPGDRTPVRAGPRHCGQLSPPGFWAPAAVSDSATKTLAMRAVAALIRIPFRTSLSSAPARGRES